MTFPLVLPLVRQLLKGDRSAARINYSFYLMPGIAVTVRAIWPPRIAHTAQGMASDSGITRSLSTLAHSIKQPASLGSATTRATTIVGHAACAVAYKPSWYI